MENLFLFQNNFTRRLPVGISKLRGTELNFKLTSKYRLLSLTCVSDSQWDVIFSEGTIIFYAIAFSRDISKIFDYNNKYDFWTNWSNHNNARAINKRKLPQKLFHPIIVRLATDWLAMVWQENVSLFLEKRKKISIWKNWVVSNWIRNLRGTPTKKYSKYFRHVFP